MTHHSNLVVAAGMLVTVLGFYGASATLAGQQSGTAIRADDSGSAGQTTVRVRGTIERYDPATRHLRVTTANGSAEFAVPSTAHVSQRGTAIDPGELERLTGSGVVVRYYADAEGRADVKSIHVFASSETVRP
jgi:hypothetical protein